MDYKIVEIEEFAVIGVYYEFTNSLKVNGDLAKKYWTNFNKKIKYYNQTLEKNWTKYAFTERINGNLQYFISIPCKEYIPNVFTRKIIGRRKYLLANHYGNINKLAETLKVVFNETIPQNRLERDTEDFIYFEKYDYRFHWSKETSVIDICVPLRY